MLRFTAERIVGMIVTMILVSLMVFIIMELPPGDYADRYAFRKYSGTGVSVTEADIQAIRVELGLDKPMILRYFDWIGNIVLHGDFGQAFAFETSVTKVIGDKAWLTGAILLVTLIITYVVSIPIGIYAAVRRGSAADYGLTIFSYLGLALPNFLLASDPALLRQPLVWRGHRRTLLGPLCGGALVVRKALGPDEASLAAGLRAGLVGGRLPVADGSRDDVG
jgi:peptide/nickel transport system permease protein